MELKADYKLIKEKGDYLSKETEELDAIFKHMLQLIDYLNGYWKGVDYEVFASTAGTYIKNLDLKVNELKYLANFMKFASKEYQTSDENFAKIINEIGDEKEWNMG